MLVFERHDLFLPVIPVGRMVYKVSAREIDRHI